MNQVEPPPFESEIAAAIPSLSQNATVALVAAYPQGLTHGGTGSLLQIGSQIYLLTARHIIKDAQQIGVPLAFTGSKERFVQCAGHIRTSNLPSPADPRIDLLDLAVIRLAPEVMEQLDGKATLKLTDLQTNLDPRDRLFSLLGYPAEWSTRATPDSTFMGLEYLLLVMESYQGSTAGSETYDEKLHLLFKIERDRIYADPNFSTAFPDRLGGISGCGIWTIGNVNQHPQTWSEDKSKLVGIQTGIYTPDDDPSKVMIKATRIDHALSFLHFNFPEVKNYFNLN